MAEQRQWCLLRSKPKPPVPAAVQSRAACNAIQSLRSRHLSQGWCCKARCQCSCLASATFAKIACNGGDKHQLSEEATRRAALDERRGREEGSTASERRVHRRCLLLLHPHACTRAPRLLAARALTAASCTPHLEAGVVAHRERDKRRRGDGWSKWHGRFKCSRTTALPRAT